MCCDEQAGSLMACNTVGMLAPAAQSHISIVSALQPAMFCGMFGSLSADGEAPT